MSTTALAVAHGSGTGAATVGASSAAAAAPAGSGILLATFEACCAIDECEGIRLELEAGLDLHVKQYLADCGEGLGKLLLRW